MIEYKSPRQGYWLATLAAVQWSTMGIFGKALFEYNADPLTVVALRAVLVFITLLAFLLLFRRHWLSIQRGDWLFFAAYGLIGVAAGFFLYFVAIDLIGVALAAVLLYTYPVFVTFLSAIFLGEQITAYKVIALVMTSGGIALVSGIYGPTSAQGGIPGIAVALLSAATVATHSIFGKKAVRKYSPWTVLLYSIGFGSFFLMVAQILFRGFPDLVRPPAFWGLLLALAWIATLGANLAYVSALARIEASRASITAAIEPVFAIFLAYIFFGETLSPMQFAGTALVLIGVLVAQR